MDPGAFPLYFIQGAWNVQCPNDLRDIKDAGPSETSQDALHAASFQTAGACHSPGEPPE
ncbi:hypothetical protein GCM10022293_31880 [Azospirillum formosense]